MDIITHGSAAKGSKFQTVLVVAGICFFAGRACLNDGLEPVGAALIGTLLLCSAHRLEGWQKAIITGSVVIIAQSVWFLAGGNTVSVSGILFSGSLAAVFCGIFEIAAAVLSDKKTNASDEVILMSISAVVMLMVIGTGVPWLVFPASLTIAVFGGYIGGIAEGLISSFASGMLLFVYEEDPMHIMWLLIFAAAAGVFKHSSRGIAGAVLAVLAAVAGVFQAIPAGLLLIFIPEIFMVKLETAVRELRMYNDSDNGKNLRELSLLFSSLDNPRSRLAYEFKAMSQLYQQKERPVRKKTRPKQYAASAAYAGSSERCGDCCQWTQLADGRFAVALSDGMGKGEGAAQESSLAVTSVIKMLQAGLDAELVLKLLNAVLMIDTGKEHFSTMDLGILDPETSEMHFYKIGAAPTVIKRKDKVEVLTAPAMPMGVAEGAIQSVSTMVRPGDQVIMMTDGIVDSVRDDMELEWLRKVLTRIKSREPQTVCDLIVREAAANYGEREKDDMTVTVLRVK